MSKLLKLVSEIQGSGVPLLSIKDLSAADATDEFPITMSKELENRKSFDGYAVTAKTPKGDRSAFVFTTDLDTWNEQIANNPALKSLKQIKPGQTGTALFKRRNKNTDLCRCTFASR